VTRVLHCITSLDLGGSQRQLALLSRVLARRGWDVHVASLQNGHLADALDPATTIHFVEHQDVRVPFRLAGLIGRLQPAVVQTWLVHMDVFGGLAALARGVPWVATERSSALGYRPRVSTGMRALLVPRADALVANSAGGLEIWRRRARPATQRLIRNAMDLDLATAGPQLPAGVTVPAGAAVIVYAGRLVADKGLRVLLEAVARVRRDRPAAAILCGTGPFEPELRRLAHDLGIASDIIFAGFVQDICAVLHRADIFVSVSLAEGSPNAVLEAMACGLPVVATDVGGVREFVVDPIGGAVVPPRNARALADALVRYLAHPEAARAAGAHNRLKASTEFSWRASALQLLDVYHRVVDARRHGERASA